MNSEDMASHDDRVLGIPEHGVIGPSVEVEPTDARDLRAMLSVFDRPRVASDELPNTLRTQILRLYSLPPSSNAAGMPLPEESRQAMSRLGVTESDFYLMPTDGGGVCYVIAGIAHARTRGLIHDQLFWNVTYRAAASGRNDIAVHGIAANDVKEVEAVFDGGEASQETQVAMTVSSNAFFGELSSVSLDPWAISRFVIHAEGRQHVLGVLDDNENLPT